MNKTRGRKFGTLLRGGILLLVSLLLGVNLYLWNAQQVVGNQLPMPFGYGLSVVLSGSMEPNISVDDLVLIRATQEVAVGDVIVYQSGSSLVIHRVIAMEGDTLTTQGDANNHPDDPITMDKVKGVMVTHIPLVGKVVRLLKRPVVVLAVVVAAIALLELSFFREKRREEQELSALKEELAQRLAWQKTNQ